MAKRFLITDTNTHLGFELLTKLIYQGNEVIAVPTTIEDDSIYKKLPQKPIAVIHWDRKSPISARNTVLKCLNVGIDLDGAIILESPQIEDKALKELRFSDIETAFDSWIKGTLFIVKELIVHFASLKKGILCLINYSQARNNSTCMLSNVIRGSFRGMLSALFNAGEHKNLNINAFSSQTENVSAYADFILKNIKEKCYKLKGKLFQYQRKSGLFSSF